MRISKISDTQYLKGSFQAPPLLGFSILIELVFVRWLWLSEFLPKLTQQSLKLKNISCNKKSWTSEPHPTTTPVCLSSQRGSARNFLAIRKNNRCHFANLPSRQQTRGNALISHADPTERGSFEVFGKIVKGLKRFCWFYNQWQAFMIILHNFNVDNINPNKI